MSVLDRYRDMSREELIARLTALETTQPSIAKTPRLPSSAAAAAGGEAGGSGSVTPEKKAKAGKKFDVRNYPCRKIALRFSYDGGSYSGLATQKHSAIDGPEVKTVEDELWKALTLTRLVGEDARMGDVGWSRCGRTDRGVSAGGQVIALWIRSRKVDQWEERRALEEYVAAKKREQGKEEEEGEEEEEEGEEEDLSETANDAITDQTTRIVAKPDSEELAYVSTLNSVLPPTIRVQAWSPVRPHFSARFDCRYRHYKYFFTSGCPLIDPPTKQGPIPKLDIEKMRFSAQKFLGDHDFRNFCRVDSSKQMDNFRRRVDGISIDEVSPPWPRTGSTARVAPSPRADGTPKGAAGDDDSERMYVLNLRGTAFLYHQVRHMVAILFLIGARLEKASIIDELLNVERGATARDRLLMRKRNLILNDQGKEPAREVQTALPSSTATEMTGFVASDNAGIDTVQPSSFALLDAELQGEDELALRDAIVYDCKPSYEMASDRPLMLWECGFKESDVEWRSGTYDGPLSQTTTSRIDGDVNLPTTMMAAQLHSHWSSLAITTEMYKHFVLALPFNVDPRNAGHIPASTLFAQSTLPTLEKASVAVTNGGSNAQVPSIVPLGDGRFKPLQAYKGLLHAKREDTPEVKNAKYLHGRGKRRADRKEREGGTSAGAEAME